MVIMLVAFVGIMDVLLIMGVGKISQREEEREYREIYKGGA